MFGEICKWGLSLNLAVASSEVGGDECEYASVNIQSLNSFV